MKKNQRIIARTKKIKKLFSGRSISNFHNGKSILKTSLNASKFLLKHGPKSTLYVVRQVIRNDGRTAFPNGIVVGKNIDVINSWYTKHGKKVTIIIPSYNDYDLVSQCIESIKKTTNEKMVRIVVVDDFCNLENSKKLKTLEDKNINVILRDKNGGFAKAVNTGLRFSKKQYPSFDVVLLNSDTIAHKDWLAALQHGAYQHSKDVGIVGPKLLYKDGRIQSAGTFRNTELPEWFDHYYRFKPENYGPANVPQYCLSVTGACMYITNKTLNRIGFLDEKFPFAFEDVDYTIRAWNKGIKTLYYPASTLTHLESATRSLNKQITEKEKGSVRYFWSKWGEWFDKRNVLNSDGRKRIIYVLQSTGVSGGHRIVFEHLNNLSEMGYDAELWALDKSPTWMQLNVPVKTFKNYKSLIKNLKEEDAIKVATWWETASPVWEASINKGIPAFIIHEVESAFYPDNPTAQVAVISSYRKEFNNIISCGFTLDEIRSLGLNGELIPCGYDNSTYKILKNSKREDNQLLAIGRTFFQKNFKQTLKSWEALDKKPKLVLFGSQPEILNKIKNKNVEYITRPADHDVSKLYNSSTVFIQTSYHEGFCLPVLEAMACGTPVICTDANGNRDFSFNGKNCLMVEKDDIEGTQEAITKLFKDKKLQDKLRKNGLKTARNYTWPVVMRKIDKFYNEISSETKHNYILKAMEKYRK